MAVFGIVMLLKPVVAFGPVIVKDNVVVVVGWFDVIVALDICELVMFPLIASSTITPLSVVADTVANEVGEGDGVAVGVGVAVGICVGVDVDVDVDVGIDGGIGAWVGVGVGTIITVNELLVPE